MIAYYQGDLFVALRKVHELVLVPHIVNDQNGWGAGFSGEISIHLGPDPERAYRSWAAGHAVQPFVLGYNQYVYAAANIVVVNMLAQRGYGRDRKQRLSYRALRACLAHLAYYASDVYDQPFMPVHMPRIGAGLGGGDWETIEAIIQDELHALDVTIYTKEG